MRNTPLEPAVLGEFHHRGIGGVGVGFRSLAGHPGDDRRPAGAGVDFERLVEADLLERPKGPADAFALDQRDRVAEPDIAVLPRLAEPDRATIAVAQLDHVGDARGVVAVPIFVETQRSEEHTSELQSLMRHSYAV